jgi:hypothetical protein
MRSGRSIRPPLEAASVATAGLFLYAAALVPERLLSASGGLSALIEEMLKTLTIAAFALAGARSAARMAGTERSSIRRARAIRLGSARKTSLALAAVAVFAAIENLSYFLAFPEAGIAARLVWSLPVHLVAALAEALGVLALAASLARARAARMGGKPESLKRRLASLSAFLAGAGSGFLWHWTANALAAGGQGGGLPGPSFLADGAAGPVFLAGAALNILAFIVLATAFSRRAYIGGFLHGAD